MSHKKGISLFSIIIVVGLMIGSAFWGALSVQAADGSGTNTVTPTSTDISTTGNTFTFTFTTAEAMDSGGISITSPAGWSAIQGINGTAGYTTVSTSGTIADVINALDTTTNWTATQHMALATSSDVNASSSPVSTLSLSNAITSTAAANEQWYFNYGSASNWGTTNGNSNLRVGYFLKSSVNAASGDFSWQDDDTASLASPLDTIAAPALTANVWTYGSATLGAATRGTVNSYGFRYTTDIGAATFKTDTISTVFDPGDSNTGWSGDTNITDSLITGAGNFMEGTGAVRCTYAAAAGTGTSGDCFDSEGADITVGPGTTIGFWVRSSVALSDGDFDWVDDNSASIGSADSSVNVPALTANTWTYVTLTSGTSDAFQSYGLRQIVDKGAMTIDIDAVGKIVDTAQATTGWTAPTASVQALATDTGVFHENAASLRNTIAAAATAGDKWYQTFGATQDWSAYTTVGFWIRSTVGTTAGQLKFEYATSNDLTSPIASVDIGGLSANTWTYQTLTLSGTRTSVDSYGINYATDIGAATIYLDDVLIGPGSPTFPGSGVVDARILSLPTSGTITTTYGVGGGASGVTAPSTAGAYTATTTSRISDSGTLTSIASHPTLTAKNPVPTTTNISPSSKTLGDAQFTMTVNGTNFVSSSIVRFNGSDRTTVFASSTQLTATIPASDMTTATTTAQITVFNPAPGGGTSNAQTFTVNKGNITITLGSSLNPSTYGQSVTFTATTTSPVSTPTGTVTFFDGVTPLATSTLSSGVATLSTSTLSISVHSITAVYNGDSNFNASTSVAVSQTVNKANITIAFGSSLNPSTYGDSVTFTATTTAIVGIPSGTVTFFDGVTSLGTSTLSNGVATIAASTLNVGVHSITATYNGDSNFNASTSAAVSQTVNKADVTITIDSSLNPSTYGDLVTFTATTTSGVGTPSGTVTFKDGGVSIATSTLTGGVATLATSSLNVGVHSITATYNGDTNFNASTSAVVSQTVNKANITITIDSSLNPSTYGELVTFTATTTGTFGAPTGTVTFFDGVTSLATSTLSSGIATLATSSLTVGVHSITAVYNGDTTYNASTSAAVSQTVNKADITITLGSSLNPSIYGDSVTFTATTTSPVSTPSGTVTFFDDVTVLATSTLIGGVATLSIDTLVVGTHLITAIYNGDANFNASTSAAVSQVVNKKSVTITLGSSLNPSTYGDTVTFTATTTAVSGTPTGNVTFFDGGVAMATSTMTGGVATFATSSLTVGIHSITAAYNGDSNFNASTSVAVSQTVNKANITIAFGSSLNPSTYGDSVTFTATTTAIVGIPSGTVTFKEGGVAFATSTLTNGVATIATSTLSVGAHSITATYNGDTVFNASTSVAVSQTVNKADITISLGSSLNPSTYGQIVTFTATTTSPAGTPTGAVTFKDGITPLATSTLSEGVATFATATLTVGTHSIIATYNGDANFNASTSVTVSQVVNNPVPVITLLSPDNAEEGSATTSLTISGSGFADDATVTFDGTPLSIGSQSSTTIETSIPASLLVAFGTSTVAVTNPTPGGGTATSSFIITRGAVRFAFSGVPYNGTVDAPITVTIQAQKENGSVATNYQSDVTLVTTGSGTGGGSVNIINGVGTTTISDTVAETVILSLSDTQSTGLDVTATTSATFAHGAITQFAFAGPATLNVGDRAAFTVTRKDQFGNPVTSGPDATAYFYTSSTSTSAVFYDAAAGGNAMTSAVIGSGTSTAMSWYYDEEPGVYTITASDNGTAPDGAAGVDDATSTLTVNAVATRFVIVDPTDGTVDAPITVVVQAQDNLGRIITDYQTDVTLIASSTSGSVSATSTLVNIINGSGTTTISDTVAETVFLSLSDSQATGLNVASSTQDAVFAPGAITQFTLTHDGDMEQNTRKEFTAGRKDQFGNYVSASTTVGYLYASPTSTVKFYDAASGGSEITFITLTPGNATTSLWFYSNAPATTTVTVSDNPAAPDGDTEINDAFNAILVTPIAIRFEIVDPTDGTVDAAITVTVRALDEFGQVVPSFNQDVAIVVTGSVVANPALVDIINGIGTTQVTDTVAETVTLSLSDSQSTGLAATSTQQVVFGVGTFAKLNLNNMTSATAGTLVPYTVTRTDQYDNQITSGVFGVDLLATPTTTPGVFYAGNSTSSSVITSVTIGSGSASAEFWYYNEAAGSYQVTAQSGTVIGYDDIVIDPATIAKLALNDRTSMNPASRVQYTVTRKDAFNNLVTSGSVTAYLYASPAGASTAFYDAATAGSVITSVTIGGGQSAQNAWYYEEEAGTHTITASDNATAPDGDAGIFDATDSIMVQVATGTRFVFDPAPTPQTLAAGASSVVTIQAQDDFGNIDTNYQSDVTLVTGVNSAFGTGLTSGQALIDIVNGEGTITLTDNVAELVNLALSDSQGTGLSVSAVSSITWSAAAVSQFILTDQTSMVAGSSTPYVVTRKDQYGNAVTSGSNLVYLYSNSTGGAKRFQVSETSTTSISFVTLSGSMASTTFWYYDEDDGTWDITASDNATTPDGATGIADASDSVIVTPAPVVADRYMILDPADAGLNEQTVVIIQAQDVDGALDTTVQEDVYLVFSTSSIQTAGLSNRRVQVSVVDGVGTVTVTDVVAETVQLSLEHLTGSTSTLAVTSTQDVMFFVRQSFAGGGVAGVYVPPTVSFIGRAYPGAKVSLFARIGGQDITLERDIEVNADGTFTIDFSGALKGLESFGLAILDKDGKIAQIKTYAMDKVTKVTAEKNLYIAPTAGLVQRTVTIGNNVGVTGSAAPGSVVRAEVDGKPVDVQTEAGRDGTYRLLINTRELAYGGHVVRTKQVDKNGIESDYSTLKVFMVSRALITRADLNNNGGVDIGDWSIFLTRFASTDTETRRQVDMNDDGKVDITDFSIFIRSTVNR